MRRQCGDEGQEELRRKKPEVRVKNDINVKKIFGDNYRGGCEDIIKKFT